MAFKEFTAGLLTAAEIDVYLMTQAVIVCTSGTRPSSPVAGMRIWQTDTLTEHVYDGSAWQFLAGINRYVRKTADESVTSSISVQNDDHLFVSVEANAAYAVELFIVTNSPSAADLKLSWSVPSGATMEWVTLAPHTAQTNKDESTISVNRLTESGIADAAGYGADVAYLPRCALYTSSTAGTLQLRWAQASSNGSATTVKTSSYLYARRIA